MKVSICGTGYVGLVSAVCFAEIGHDVICVDVDPSKVRLINDGKAPFYEPGLELLLNKAVQGGKLRATISMEEAIGLSEITFIAVGTPFDGTHIDLTFIEQAARDIGNELKKKNDFHTVVVKSTVVPGTTEGLVKATLELVSGKKIGKEIGLGMNPEFLREGEAIKDFLSPDRIVIGSEDQKSKDVIKSVYSYFVDVSILEVNSRSAEMIKYASNCLFATLISFSNEMANIASSFGNID
ncbi:MAG: UDP-glucose/GDP-mannose dehydrogenase family protein, partial [Sphingobacteriales bacterium]